MGVIGYGRPACNRVEGKRREEQGGERRGPLFVAAARCLPVWQCRTVVCACVYVFVEACFREMIVIALTLALKMPF